MSLPDSNVRRLESLSLDPFGRLVARLVDGSEHLGVQPVRAFPLSAADEGFALLDTDGHELVWLASLDELPPAERELLAAELAAREFTPEITRLVEVSTYNLPSVWTVETDRGATTLILKALEDIRAVTSNSLLIADSYGINYRVRDLRALDKKSRRLLEHFM
jgi:hypothetical protein